MDRGVFAVVFLCLLQYIARSIANGLFTNTWVVYTELGNEYVDKLARKRGFINHGQQGGLEGYYLLEHKRVSRRTKRSLDHHTEHFLKDPNIKYAEQQRILSRQKRGYLSDPMFKDQWYLENTGQSPGPKGLDINVLPVWKKNISGKNVVVTILDDGIEYTHPDLHDNYEPSASWDFNSRDSDPMPRYTSDKVNKHGTRCAGEVAGKKENGVCGVGVAYNARIGGIRMLDGDVTDSVEGSSLSLKSNFIDIYSSSWGPDDDGRTVDGPGSLAKKAFRDGITKGRKGRGSIFVWATGNGGRFNDYCSCDGYITSIFTISIGAVNDRGKSPWYAEPCPATLAVTYSSGEPRGPDLKIVTTDLDKQCTKEHTGTSAAAPLAAGIFALVVEANPLLTWRDLQHLIVNTSIKTDPHDSEWQVNGAGHHVNNKYGFGVLDTSGLVESAMARNWKTVGRQHICKELGSISNHRIPKKDPLILTLDSTGCAKKPNCVTSLEHVRVYITISHRRRGSLTISLTSPSGTKSDLLKLRSKDYSDKGFQNWPFMTVFSWGENPRGKWTLEVRDHSGLGGTLERWSLRLYGTCIEPSPNITVKEEKTCKNTCKKGCPLEFATLCKNCSQYCQCSDGKCVRYCDEEDEVIEASKHCLPPNTFTDAEKHICSQRCTNRCPKSAFCSCRTGQCVKACGNEDKIDAKYRYCITPEYLYAKSHHVEAHNKFSFNTWVIIFSTLGVLLAGVLVLYMLKAKHRLCWSRPSLGDTSPQRNVSYAPVSLSNDHNDLSARTLPAEEEQHLVENTV